MFLPLSCVLFMLIPQTHTYASGGDWLFRFWAAGLVSAAVYVVVGLLINYKWKLFNKKGIITWFLIFGAFMYCTGAGGTDFINRNFDKSEPTSYVVTVLDKDYDFNRRSPDDYSFDVEIEGERVKIHVSDNTYRSHEVGDKLFVFKYSGVFGHEYYTAYKK